MSGRYGSGPGRRAVLGGTAAAASALALAGCGGSTGQKVRKEGQKISLTFWSWVPMIGNAVDLWNKRNPDVQVNLELLSAIDGIQYAKMNSAVKAKNPPDLAQIEFPIISAFVLDGALLDLTKIGDTEAARRKFTGWQWKQSVFGKSVFAIPQASGPMGMFLRQDLFDKWGIEVPGTWDEYERAAEQVRKNGAYIETFASPNSQRFTGYAWQAGAKWFRAEGDEWIITLDDGPTRKVADYWENLVRRKLIMTIPDQRNAWYKDVQTGSIVGWLAASWGDALLVGNGGPTAGKWRAHPMPQWEKGADAQANWGGSTTAVFKGCTYPRDAMDFAVWLNSDPDAVQALIKGGAGWPAAKKGWKPEDTEMGRKFFGGQHYSHVFEHADKGVDTSWQWGPLMDTLNLRLWDAFNDALAEGTPFRKVLRTVQKEHVDDLRTKGLKVRAG
ncbi:sugar ABC transporter substrate-binding protein [Streptomyces sp. ODS28]|uniref:ABC transporter substrate-binding protein n=1 Tax=Streptomyces sp. ODS28 TaxID=3136688 RepID=UPI0031E790E1